MIFDNLFFVENLFVKHLDKDFDFEDLAKNGISLLKVRSSSREFEQKAFSGNFEIEYRINPKELRSLSSTYKLYTYIILRLLAIRYPESLYGVSFLDFRNYLNTRTFSNNERYFYLELLDNNQFLYEIDTVLWQKRSCRNFYRILYQRIPEKDNKRLIDLIINLVLSGKFIFIPKDRPKRVQRHKGYRDHGSMGSDFSKTLKDQSNDWTVRQEENEEGGYGKQDLIDFLLGLGGWI